MARKKKTSLTPQLRFPEFRDKGEWEQKPLDSYCHRIKDKVGGDQLIPVSISAGIGFVPQEKKFGRDISGSQYTNYIRIERGDFAYNRGNSKRFPQGCVYQLSEFDQAAASSAFLCFRLKEGYEPKFFLGLFEKNTHGRQLLKDITSGARSNGLLNINANTFFGINIPMPKDPAEQSKIAACLGSLDDLIAAEDQKLSALRDQKRGLMQQLFPQPGETQPRLRFPEFRDHGEWDNTSIKGVCKMKAGDFVRASDIHEKQGAEMFPCYGGNGLRGYTKTFTHHGKYTLVGRQGALCGNVLSFDGRFHATEHALVVTPKKNIVTDWLYYALGHLKLNQYAIGQAQPGLSVGVLESVRIDVPATKDEQQRIADCLSVLDARIAAQAVKLDSLKTHKKGLMQQLFPSPEDYK